MAFYERLLPPGLGSRMSRWTNFVQKRAHFRWWTSWALIIDIRFIIGPDPMMLCWLLRNQFLMYNIAFTRLSSSALEQKTRCIMNGGVRNGVKKKQGMGRG